jgi:cytochrome c oxidase subunit IV
MNPSRHVSSPALYFKVWGALMLLLLVTWGVAQVNLHQLNIVAAMTIAVVKLLLVILYFMHVRHSSRVTWLFVAAGFFWLSIMFTLTMGDYLSRGAFHQQ